MTAVDGNYGVLANTATAAGDVGPQLAMDFIGLESTATLFTFTYNCDLASVDTLNDNLDSQLSAAVPVW